MVRPASFSECHICGEVPEWSNGAVSKTVVRYAYPGFESLSLRQFVYLTANPRYARASDGAR